MVPARPIAAKYEYNPSAVTTAGTRSGLNSTTSRSCVPRILDHSVPYAASVPSISAMTVLTNATLALCVVASTQVDDVKNRWYRSK